MATYKFRAWDGNRMLYRTLFDRNWYDSDDIPIAVAMPHDINKMYIMQSTEVKDKNGKYSYKNDIVLYKDDSGTS